jgi:NADH-quinone oxidoreductase subunit J
MTVPFAILAVLTIAGAAAAMSLRNVVHCVLALALSFGALAAVYLRLGAQLIGLVQVLVYIGAVAILMVFAILLTRGEESTSLPLRPSTWLGSATVAVAVFGVLAWAVHASGVARRIAPAEPEATVSKIGEALMLRFVLPLEVMGLLLTAALVGAVIVAMHERQVHK